MLYYVVYPGRRNRNAGGLAGDGWCSRSDSGNAEIK